MVRTTAAVILLAPPSPQFFMPTITLLPIPNNPVAQAAADRFREGLPGRQDLPSVEDIADEADDFLVNYLKGFMAHIANRFLASPPHEWDPVLERVSFEAVEGICRAMKEWTTREIAKSYAPSERRLRAGRIWNKLGGSGGTDHFLVSLLGRGREGGVLGKHMLESALQRVPHSPYPHLHLLREAQAGWVCMSPYHRGRAIDLVTELEVYEGFSPLPSDLRIAMHQIRPVLHHVTPKMHSLGRRCFEAVPRSSSLSVLKGWA